MMTMMMMFMMMMLDLLSAGPETVVLNADAVYVTTYSVLHLAMTLRQSAYFTNTEKSLPLSEVNALLFNPFQQLVQFSLNTE